MVGAVYALRFNVHGACRPIILAVHLLGNGALFLKSPPLYALLQDCGIRSNPWTSCLRIPVDTATGGA